MRMADVHNPEQRSYNMSRIRSKNTKPEEFVRKYLFARGFRYRKNDPRLPGKPDIVLPKYKTVIFINGCFWHGHTGCKYFVWPRNNENFWREKINGNIARDQRTFDLLQTAGWNVIVVWECQLKKHCNTETLSELEKQIQATFPVDSGIARTTSVNPDLFFENEQ